MGLSSRCCSSGSILHRSCGCLFMQDSCGVLNSHICVCACHRCQGNREQAASTLCGRLAYIFAQCQFLKRKRRHELDAMCAVGAVLVSLVKARMVLHQFHASIHSQVTQWVLASQLQHICVQDLRLAPLQEQNFAMHPYLWDQVGQADSTLCIAPHDVSACFVAHPLSTNEVQCMAEKCSGPKVCCCQ